MNLAVAHCRNSFHREFAYKTVPGIDEPNAAGEPSYVKRKRSKPVSSADKLEFYMNQYKNRWGMYVSVYAFAGTYPHPEKGYKCVEYSTAKINRIYLDFDDEENPQNAIDEALFVVRELSKHKIYCHCYFSGSKGIAMYIEFITMDFIPKNKKEIIARFYDIIENTIAKYENFFGMAIELIQPEFAYVLHTLDTTVRGDIGRVSRIPNSLHKSGFYCIPVSFGDMYKGLDHIHDIATDPVNIDLDKTIITCMRRNTKILTILTNIEKTLEAERVNDITQKKINQRKLESYKRSGKYDTSFDEVIKRAKSKSISDIIGESADRIKCPIHGGDNPTSLQIDHDKNLWYCHSCQKGGDGITYIMELRGLSFVDAVNYITGS